MSDLIDTVQLQDTNQGLVQLFEITLPTGDEIFAYTGLDLENGVNTVQFLKRGSTSVLNNYIALPMQVDGIDWKSDGAYTRPTLTVANLVSVASSLAPQEGTLAQELQDAGITDNEGFLGSRIVIRTTTTAHLGVTGSLPVEFPTQIYVVDRISGEDNVFVSFELASPFDVEGVQIPGRVVVGKYCSWKYTKDGCTWKPVAGKYFDINGNWINNDSANDVCGKTLKDCKLRFQFNTSDATHEDVSKLNSNVPLPFGAFPGSRKFR